MNGDLNSKRHCRVTKQRGTMMVCTLVCLLVAVALITTSLQHSLRGRREVRVQNQMLQTEFLLDAGITRAIKQLKANADYTGETWRPAAIDQSDNPLVEIVVADGRVNVNASLGEPVHEGQQLIASQTKRSYSFPLQELKSTPETFNAE